MSSVPHSPEIPYGYCQCGCGQRTPLAQRTNYARFALRGKPQRYLPGHQNRGRIVISLADRFWSKVDKSGGPDACWLWTGAFDGHGYGQIRISEHNHIASRVAWELANDRPVPGGLDVMHSCDNPPCVNPAHLSVGTASDNLREMARKGRAPRVHKRRPG